MSNVKLPVDLTPAQRATARLVEMVAIIALFNGLMAGLAYLSGGQVFEWHAVLLVVGSQVALAGLAAVAKYYKATNQPALSDLFDLVRQEAVNEMAGKVPAAPLSPSQQAIQDAVNALLSKQLEGASAPGEQPQAQNEQGNV